MSLGSGISNTLFCTIIRYYLHIMDRWGYIMKTLDKCPKCNSELELENDSLQVCKVCKYWTKAGTARLDSITIMG
ncbi:Hypothetical protein Mbur_1321 [Methanococcoides burtonii DSM 6242]|uniref:Uncharacterized protein n=1 Tax=Methanococcoides burtonii (strain DSM 6242 / NBRC 107633 / OCM 468 / ACE-M) TaxID=259564 RepID=Q12WD7_METBU|nr:Hypothetical protein Mbur_1321 [Methanococcoides burtonii DSM 6242]